MKHARDSKKQPPRWAEYLSEELAEIDRRLRNWARWSKGGLLSGPGHCGSVEHKYVAPRDDDKAEIQSRQATEGIDSIDAEIVEAAVAGLPRRERIVGVKKFVVECRERVFVRSFYLRSQYWRETCRHLKIETDMFPAEHSRALAVVAGVLRAAARAAEDERRRRPAKAA